MKTTFDVLDLMYQALNVTEVTSTIDGKIWRRKKPLDRSNRDIVITPLTIKDGEVIQEGTLFVNIYCKNLQSGQPDEAKLELTLKAVEKVIESISVTGTFFQLFIAAENVYTAEEDDSMSYASVRVEFKIER